MGSQVCKYNVAKNFVSHTHQDGCPGQVTISIIHTQYMRLIVQTYLHTHTHAHTRIHTIYEKTHIHTHTHTRAHTHARAHAYTHVHTRALVLPVTV